MFCAVQKPYNERQKKETLRFSHGFFAYMHLPKRENFHSYSKSRKFLHMLAFLINRLVYRAIKCTFIWLSDRLKPELRDRWGREKLVTVAYFKGIQDKNTIAPKGFLKVFIEEIMDYKGELKLVL